MQCTVESDACRWAWRPEVARWDLICGNRHAAFKNDSDKSSTFRKSDASFGANIIPTPCTAATSAFKLFRVRRNHKAPSSGRSSVSVSAQRCHATSQEINHRNQIVVFVEALIVCRFSENSLATINK